MVGRSWVFAIQPRRTQARSSPVRRARFCACSTQWRFADELLETPPGLLADREAVLQAALGPERSGPV
jgi:hypothetical protein